ncbi:MAG: hypothetical protein J5808_04420 [Paludibacteraceae bacterium]|nr:hypothetical protein [Paludibacteraceae bacterium]
MKKLLLALAAMLAFTFTARAQEPAQPEGLSVGEQPEVQQIPAFSDKYCGKMVVGYMPSYRTYTVNSIDWSALTHCVLSFIRYANGSLITSDFSDADVRNIVSKCHANNVKVIVAIGGWNGFQNDGAFTTAQKRTNFCNIVMNYVNTYGLDGVDIDIELTDADIWNNFQALTSELKGRLGSGKSLSMAVSTWFTDAIPNAAYNNLDFINLMSYDANTNGSGDHAPQSLINNMISYYNARGVSNSRMTIGVPFYGYNSGGAKTYSEIIAMDRNNANRDYYNGIYYNGIPTIKSKAEFSKGYAGTMIWELGQDTFDDTSLLKAIKSVMGNCSGGGGGGNTTNYAISTSNVTSLANGKTHNFTVNYTAPAAADIWVTLYRTGDYNLVAEKKLQVAAASSSTSKTISLTIGSDVEAGNDYILFFDIRPRDAGWQQRAATKEFKFISITSSLTWSISTSHVTSLDNNKTHTFSVNYSAAQTADMWVTLYKGNDYALVSENKISNIAAGTGTKSITLNVPGSVAAGNDYIVFFDIRPAGSDWQQRAASQEDKNVTIKNTVAQATIPAAPERKHYDKEKLCYVKGTTYNNFNYVLDWGQSATASKEANSKSIKLAFNSGNVGHYLGSCFGDYAVLNVTETPYLHFHAYTDGTSMTSFDWYCISQGPAEDKKNIALTKGQWKEYTIDLRTLSGVDLSKFFQFKWCCKDDRGVDGNVYIDNIFFSGTNVPTGVADVAEASVSVFAAGGAVVIAGAQDQRVRVVDLTGRTLVNTVPASDYEQIPMGKGLYLVLVGNQTYKVSVR